MGTVRYEQEIQLDLINKWLHMALMSRATYLWYSLHIKLMSLIAMFASLLFMVSKKRVAEVSGDDKVDGAGWQSPDPIIMAIALQYLLELGDMITVLLNEYRDLEYRVMVMQSCFTLLDIPQEPSDQPRIEDDTWPQKGDIEVRDLNFRYRPNLDLILENVRFKIKAGEKIGVVGRTGAGKSTLTLALMRLIDSEKGQILIDGVNILEKDLQQIRQKITIIPQD